MSNGRNASFPAAARRPRKSSNMVFQHLEGILAVDVRTPSRSNRTASKWPGVIGSCGDLMAVAPMLALHVVPFGRSGSSVDPAAQTPAPLGDCWQVVAIPRDVLLVLDQLLLDRLLEVGGAGAQLRQPGDPVPHEMEPVEVVEHPHGEGGHRRALFLVPADVEAIGIASATNCQLGPTTPKRWFISAASWLLVTESGPHSLARRVAARALKYGRAGQKSK